MTQVRDFLVRPIQFSLVVPQVSSANLLLLRHHRVVVCLVDPQLIQLNNLSRTHSLVVHLALELNLLNLRQVCLVPQRSSHHRPISLVEHSNNQSQLLEAYLVGLLLQPLNKLSSNQLLYLEVASHNNNNQHLSSVALNQLLPQVDHSSEGLLPLLNQNLRLTYLVPQQRLQLNQIREAVSLESQPHRQGPQDCLELLHLQLLQGNSICNQISKMCIRLLKTLFH